MEQKVVKMNRRESSFRSANEFFRNNEKHTNSLVEKFELTYPILAVADADETPVNILCLDGGGMKGYALPVILNAINEKYGKGKETGILEHFDLVAGTSVGGAFAITCNLMKSLQESCDEFTDGADDIRERVFSKMKVKNLLKTGASVAKEDQMEVIYKARWGDTPLLNPLGPKAMAVASVRSSNNNRRKESYQPIVLRTYGDCPNVEMTKELKDLNSDSLVASSSSLTAAQAIAATTAIPGVVHSIKAQLDGREVSLVDGGLYGNCPLHIAIDEARQLYPGRPLGVVLSIGYDDKESALRDRVIKVARRVSPNLHFHRLAPSHITTEFKVSETSLHSVVEMEEKVNDFIWADGEVSSALDVTIKKLYSNQTPPAKPEFLRRQAMLQNGKFQERARSRQHLREIFRNDSSQSRSSTGNGMSNSDLSLSSSQYSIEKTARCSISRDDIASDSITDVSRTTNSTKENTAKDIFITEEKGIPSRPINILDKTNSTLSLSFSTEEFHTISLKNEEDGISTEENNNRCSTSCNTLWWARCIPCFAPCGGCNVVPEHAIASNEVDNVNLKIKAISMNREEI